MAEDNFLQMARGFGDLLPQEQRGFWDQIVQQYENADIFSQDLVITNLRALQKLHLQALGAELMATIRRTT